MQKLCIPTAVPGTMAAMFQLPPRAKTGAPNLDLRAVIPERAVSWSAIAVPGFKPLRAFKWRRRFHKDTAGGPFQRRPYKNQGPGYCAAACSLLREPCRRSEVHAVSYTSGTKLITKVLDFPRFGRG